MATASGLALRTIASSRSTSWSDNSSTTVPSHASRSFAPMRCRRSNQRLRFVDEEVVELRSSLTSDFENILKSRCGYQDHAAAASFEKGIGAYGRIRKSGRARGHR